MTPQEIKELLGNNLTITPDQLFATGIFKVSRNGIYAAINRGEIAAIEIGHKKAVITAPLRKQLGLEA